MKTNYRTMPSQVLRPEDYCITQDNMADRHMMTIPDDVYRELAELMRIECEYSGRDYVQLTFEVERDERFYALTLSAFCYFETITAPDNIWRNLTDIVPVWWECHTYDAVGEERLNDFNFKMIRNFF